MKLSRLCRTWIPAVTLPLALGAATVVARADVTLVQNGVARASIYATPTLMADDAAMPTDAGLARRETERRRLRESVKDLALYLEKMSGVNVEVLTQAPAGVDQRVPILIGELAVQAFGPPAQKSTDGLGWRIVVAPKGVGLIGETDRAASFAIYELLDRLGCRWYLPGQWGEVIPSLKTITLRETDVSDMPPTISRDITYADANYARRNRLTFSQEYISTAHALEAHSGDRYGYLTRQQLEANPDWNAMIGGKRSINGRFCWGNPEVSAAVAESIIAELDRTRAPSISISPEDGATFCECPLDKALDAGDWDPTMNQVSITDRFVHFANRIATRVVQKHPSVKLGFLAYVQYTRAPIREKLHPNLVPQIAPITYCRAHTMEQHICPSRQSLRKIVEGWGKASPNVAYYNYMFHLAEVAVPYPMMKQMSDELPIIYANNLNYWTPETMPVFDSVLPGMVLTHRYTWDRDTKPAAVLDEFFTRFYGGAAEPMRRYWQTFDDAWTQVPEHAGSGFGYMRRFTPAVMQTARTAMDAALAAAKTPEQQQRVQMQDASLRQFELFMKLRHDLHEGRLVNLEADSQKWLATQKALSEEYAPQYAFSKVAWTSDSIAGYYFNAFFGAAYTDAGQITKNFEVISPPLNDWRYQVDKDQNGEATGWSKTDFNDKAWKTTDPMVETWASLGLMEYMGSVWYRHTVQVPQVPAGKKVYLWLSSTDGDAEVFVNGRHIPYVNEKGEKSDKFSGFAQAASFDVTGAIKPGANNQITVIGTRTAVNELGTGGLLGPVYLYREK